MVKKMYGLKFHCVFTVEINKIYCIFLILESLLGGSWPVDSGTKSVLVFILLYRPTFFHTILSLKLSNKSKALELRGEGSGVEGTLKPESFMRNSTFEEKLLVIQIYEERGKRSKFLSQPKNVENLLLKRQKIFNQSQFLNNSIDLTQILNNNKSYLDE